MYLALRGLRNRASIILHRTPSVHRTAYIDLSARVAADLTTDEYAFVGKACTIGPNVHIGRYTMLASLVAIVGDDHVYSNPRVPMQFSGRPPQSRTLIGHDVWVGHGAILRRGVTIGDGSIIGAGSVVTRDIPPREVWAGTPARFIRRRFIRNSDDHRHELMVDGPVQDSMFSAPQ